MGARATSRPTRSSADTRVRICCTRKFNAQAYSYHNDCNPTHTEWIRNPENGTGKCRSVCLCGAWDFRICKLCEATSLYTILIFGLYLHIFVYILAYATQLIYEYIFGKWSWVCTLSNGETSYKRENEMAKINFSHLLFKTKIWVVAKLKCWLKYTNFVFNACSGYMHQHIFIEFICVANAVLNFAQKMCPIIVVIIFKIFQ